MLLLLLAIALALLLVPTRERLEPTATIKAPTVPLWNGRMGYDSAERDRIAALVPGLLNEYTEAYNAQAGSSPLGGPTAATIAARSGELAQVVADAYGYLYAPATEPLTDAKIDAYTAAVPLSQPPLLTRLLKAYFLPSSTGTPPPATTTGTTGTGTTTGTTTGTGTTGTGTTGTGTSSATTTIKVPRQDTGPVEAPYDAAEMDRILTLSPTAKTQRRSLLANDASMTDAQKDQLVRLYLANIIKQFYLQVYSTTLRPIQESDLDTFIPTIRDTPPEAKTGIKELLQRYYMGAAAAQGPTQGAPKSYTELNAEYQAKVAEYQTKVSAALAANDASALPGIRALNERITTLLEEMMTSLDPLRQDTTVARAQREELAAVLASLERDYAGLKDTSDSMGRLRRIREMQKGATEGDLKLYGVLFVSACLAVFVIAMSKT